MTAEDLTAFAARLADDVEQGRQTDGGETYSEREFTRQVLERLGEDGIVEDPVFVREGEVRFQRRSCRITGFALSEDQDRLLLITTIYTGEVPPRLLARDEKLTAIKQALNFYECSSRGLHEHIEPSNTDASDLARRIHESGSEIATLRMILLSDAVTGLDSIDLRNPSGLRVVVDLYGIERLQRIIGQGMVRDDIAIDFERDYGEGLPCLPVGEGGPYGAFLAALPGAVLADVYEKYGTRLLELNVRAFLGLRGRTSVNQGLRRTIRDAPTDFLAFNNGIVATVDEVSLSDDGGPARILSLRGLQIVNGGQTTAGLHRARRVDRADLESIQVPAKIILARDEDVETMIRDISRFANAQNTVQLADFSANDPFHRRIEQLANEVWLPDGSGRWFYERARGSYEAGEFKAASSKEKKKRFASETPKSRRFSKTDVAKYVNGWDGYPHLVSFGNQKNFASLMERRKTQGGGTDDMDAEWYRRFVAKAVLFRAVQKRVRQAGFPAYQANIAVYTFSLLASRLGDRLDLGAVWERQGISDGLGELIDRCSAIVDRELREGAQARMPSEWAKKEACWAWIRDVRLPADDAVPELRRPEGRRARGRGSGVAV